MTRISAMKGSDVMMALGIIHTINRLNAARRQEDAQSFLTLLWTEWRRDGDKMEYAPHVFDFYFHTHGDFETAEKTLLAGCPREHQEYIRKEMIEYSDKALKELEGQKFTHGVQVIPASDPGELKN